MWDLDCEESWALKNWCFWTVVLEKILESPLDCKEIQPVHPKGDQSRVFIGRTDAKLKLQYFGHLMWRTDSLEKTLMLGKIEDGRRRGWQRMRWLDGITDSMDMSLSKFKLVSKRLSQLFTSGSQNIRVSGSTWVFPMNTLDWSPLGWTGWVSMQSQEISSLL